MRPRHVWPLSSATALLYRPASVRQFCRLGHEACQPALCALCIHFRGDAAEDMLYIPFCCAHLCMLAAVGTADMTEIHSSQTMLRCICQHVGTKATVHGAVTKLSPLTSSPVCCTGVAALTAELCKMCSIQRQASTQYVHSAQFTVYRSYTVQVIVKCASYAQGRQAHNFCT